MKKFLTPIKDTTLYQTFPTNNAGFDEILEIGKTVDPDELEPSYVSASARTLIQFDTSNLPVIPTGSKYFLNLRLAHASNVQRNQIIEVFPISSSWTEGSGYLYQNIKNVNDGATWTQSAKNMSWSLAGGDTIPTPSASISLTDYPMGDLRIDVTALMSESVSPNGLLLKFPSADEVDGDNLGNVKVFSAQTHTIHQPTLEVAWDDQVFVTGSLVSGSIDGTAIVLQNLKEKYIRGEISRINLVVRDEFPLRSFNSTLRYKAKYYLPSTTYFSITDVQSNTTILEFDEYSKVSCDANGVYLVLDTLPLYKGRFYKIRLKTDVDGYTRIVDSGWTFQVV